MHTRTRALAALLVVLAVSTSACNRDPSTIESPAPADAATPAFPVTVFGDNGEVTVERRPERIVSLSPTATEMLFAIGAGEQVVAVDELSNYPPDAPVTDLSGYTPNLEAIAGYDADLVVFATETGSLSDDLSGLGIAALQQDAVADFDDIYAQIAVLGAATGRVAEAATVVAGMQADLAVLQEQLPAGTEGLTYFHELDPTYYSVTSASFIGAVYTQFGLVNIADQADGAGDNPFPQLSAEFILEQDPDLVFLADGACCNQTAETVAERPGWSDLTAVRTGGVIVVDEDLASRWGPRVIDFLGEISLALAERQPAEA